MPAHRLRRRYESRIDCANPWIDSNPWIDGMVVDAASAIGINIWVED